MPDRTDSIQYFRKQDDKAQFLQLSKGTIHWLLYLLHRPNPDNNLNNEDGNKDISQKLERPGGLICHCSHFHSADTVWRTRPTLMWSNYSRQSFNSTSPSFITIPQSLCSQPPRIYWTFEHVLCVRPSQLPVEREVTDPPPGEVSTLVQTMGMDIRRWKWCQSSGNTATVGSSVTGRENAGNRRLSEETTLQLRQISAWFCLCEDPRIPFI